MKKLLHFLLTCGISTGALLGATKAPNPWPNFVVMLAVWFIYIWRNSARAKR